MSQWAVDMRRKGLFWRLGEVLLDCGGPAGWGFFARTFAVYEDLCSVSVCPHQYGLVIYLFLRQACLGVDDFEELEGVSFIVLGGSCLVCWERH